MHRMYRLDAIANGDTVDEELKADPFEQEAYVPLVRLKDIAKREAALKVDKERVLREEAEAAAKRKEEQRREDAALADKLAIAENAAAQRRRMKEGAPALEAMMRVRRRLQLRRKVQRRIIL